MWCYNVLALSCFFRFIFIFGIIPCFYGFYALNIEPNRECAGVLTFCFSTIVMGIVTVVNVLLVIVNICMSARRSYETNEFKDKLRGINKKELLVIVFFIAFLCFSFFSPTDNMSFFLMLGLFFSGCIPIPFFALVDILFFFESEKEDGMKLK